MSTTLKEALGAHGHERGGALWAVPADERALLEVLHILGDRHARLNHDVWLSRERLDGLGPIEVRSMTVDAGAGVSLLALDDLLRTRSLTLGALPPSAWKLRLAEFLEGPLAGLRAIPGGRLEPLVARLEALLPDGKKVSTPPGPRSATGPDLTALFLGGQGRLGLVTRAQVRAFRAATHRASAVWRFSTVAGFVGAVRRALSDGASPGHLACALEGGHVLAELHWGGSEQGVERERGLLTRVFTAAGARALAALAPMQAHGDERELGWDQVSELLASGAPLELHRLSLASVVAVGGASARPPASCWSSCLQALAQVVDPAGVLGGAP